MQRIQRFSPRAFTLTEVRVVIGVGAVLATFVAQSLSCHVNDARMATAKAHGKGFGTAPDPDRLGSGQPGADGESANTRSWM
jgi:prepilin-type N-terminal cleavage/methylation domain-containing protein